jgi:hypothetical protein
MPTRRLTFAYLAALAAFAASPAAADGEIERIITAADRERLKGFDAARNAALTEAKAQGAATDLALFENLLAAPKESFGGFDLTGQWQCRTIKAGGLAGLVVYDWFKCRVSDDGSGWRLEKNSGSQRTAGRFFTDGDAKLIYLGAGYIAGERPAAYGAGPDSDQAGYAFRSGPKDWRIEFPAPRYESRFDILEFRR